MARTKFKPNKSVAKRFKDTKTGKLKRGHSYTSHLMSARPGKVRRKLDRPAILSETHAKGLRKLMGFGGISPGRVRHKRALAAAARAEAGTTAAETK